ncbi:MAG: Rrf2 family transcriptional regulator [Spirochaetales bacterium]|nr:Rrf2 family transcriptional regulator [Spirochaetales bacterium]
MVTISTRVRYGLRALLELAKNPDMTPVSLHSIADKLGISFKYLENIFKFAKHAGIVQGVRGPEGGYVLVKQPEDLTVYEVVSALDGPVFSTECTDDDALCSRLDLCSLRGLWNELQDTVGMYLKKRTLADLLKLENEIPEKTILQLNKNIKTAHGGI